MGCFGTGAMLIEEDIDDVFRCYTFPIGSYMIANNEEAEGERVLPRMADDRPPDRSAVRDGLEKTASRTGTTSATT